MFSADDSREVYQLMTIANFYLGLAEDSFTSLSPSELHTSIGKNAERPYGLWNLHTQSPLDRFFAHIGSAAVRLATAREFYAENAHSNAYDGMNPQPTKEQIEKARQEDLELFLRDNIGHRERDTRAKAKAPKRKAVLNDLTPLVVFPLLKGRFNKIKRELESRGRIGPIRNEAQA
jgi:hypothetical protein